jgi:hypothetical protein
MLLKEFKYVFTWIYNNMKAMFLEFVQHRIELNTSIPPPHQARYKLNPNYATTIKQNINKLFAIGFIQPIKEAAWLSFIVVMFKMNEKLRACVDFKKLNRATKKNPYPSPFSNEVLNIVARYEAYSFLEKYSRYHQIPLRIDTKQLL